MWQRSVPPLLVLSIVVVLLTVPSVPAGAEVENPNHGRGFSPEKAFDIGDVDHVNLFNGTLNLTVPVGQSYPLSGGLSYSLTLSYGSALWEWQDFCEFTTNGLICDYRSSPNLDDNAGFGWRFHMGRLLEPFDPPRNSSPYWVYESPDGATHSFHATLHHGDSQVTGVRYTRDGSYLRMKDLSGGVKEIEFPDGTIHKFDSLGRLIQIRNRFPTVSKLDVSRQFNAAGELSKWVITDSAGRTHRVNFTTRTLLEDGGTWEKIPMVSSVDFQGFGGARRIWTFSYQNATYTAPRVDAEGPDHTYRVPLLTQVTQPDNAAWFIGSANYDFEGRITRIELPTLGKIAWQYGTYNFPKLDVFDKTPTEDPTEDPYTHNRGVIRRTTLTRSNQTEGVWTYSQTLFSSPDRTRTWVTDPLGHERRHHFSADPEVTQYGLPFHPINASGGRNLSVQIYHSNGTKMRSEYVRYEWDAVPFVDASDPPSDRYEVNRRVASKRTLYHLDGNRRADVDFSDFDGLGHYRKTVTGGNFGEGDVRESFTNFNRFRGTYQHLGAGTGHTFTMLPTTSPWVLGTFNEQWNKEDGVTEKRQVCMESGNGFVTRERLLAGSSVSSKDVLRVFERNSSGDRTREKHYGGDTQAISTASSNVCNIGIPSSEQYSIRHTYTKGVLATSKYETSPGTSIGYLLVDQTIDTSTGLPSSSRDSAGIQITYLYDSMDRRTWARPQGGHGAWTQFGYLNATGTNPARVNVFEWPNGTTGGSALAERQLRFDGFGRLTQERRRKPDANWATKETGYNALGWKTYETSTETGTNPVNQTSFLQYDPFGRPAIVRPPEGSQHDVSFLYRGVRETERTVRIGTSRNATTGQVIESTVTFSEVHDRQGRLWKVWEDEGVTNWLTTYGYDTGNRLSSVSMTRGTTTQQRRFNYDGRGFLLSECHPEKGSFGNGCVSYFNYDSKGHAGRIVDGPQDLTFSYDRAERLTQVRETFGSQRTLKEFVYANFNSFGWSAGKLRSTTRHNYFPEFGGIDFPVEETFTYSGKGGRVSRLETRINVNDIYRQDFVWDDLGNLSHQTYPTCQHFACTFSNQPSRTVSYGYTQGWLTSVPGWATGIFYHANGLVAQINHANGVVTTQATDSTQRARPASISVKKGTAPLYLSGSYFYDGAGNVTRMGTDYYLYDRVGRLVEGTVFQDGNNEKQLYEFDGFGNLTEIETYAGSFLTQRRTISVTPSTNRLSAAGYDAAGRQLTWGSYAYSWEPGGHMYRLSGGGNNRFYAYGSDDERYMTFDADTGRSLFRIRGLDGKVLREFSHEQSTGLWLWEKDWIYREGKLLGTVSAAQGTRHAHLDHLGTPRVFSDSSGIGRERRHYFPFGEEALSSGGSNVVMGFTGHELDGNDSTGTTDDLTYMVARYQHPQLGRFLSFDPGDSAKPAKPQTWNKYGYAVNNPVRFVDPDGEDPQERIGDFVAGMGNALSNNITLGGIPRENGNAAFRAGQALGDGFSLAFGAVEALLGGSTVVSSTGCAALTGGGCLPVAAPAAAGGVALTAHGTATMTHAAGNLGGSISQMQSGSTQSGGRGRGANRLDRKQVDAAARKAGIKDRATRKEFGKFIEAEKDSLFRGGKENFTFEDLIKLAEDYLEMTGGT